jgi:hypothetical protein
MGTHRPLSRIEQAAAVVLHACAPTMLGVGKLPESSVTHVSGRIRDEGSDSYPRVIARLNDRWRVVACKNDVQWVLQRRSGQHWGGQYFCRTREALIRFAHRDAGEIAGDALVILLRLPVRFPDGVT